MAYLSLSAWARRRLPGPLLVTLVLALACGARAAADVAPPAAGAITGATLPLVSVTASDDEAREDDLSPGVFTFTRDGDTSRPLTVVFRVTGPARAGRDYQALGYRVVFPAGSATVNLSVTPLPDTEGEFEEYVMLELRPNGAYALGGATSASIRLISATAPPEISVTASVAEATEAGLTPGAFTISRSGDDLSAPLTVGFAIAGNATPGKDYVKLANRVIIPAGEGSVTLPVLPTQDDVPEMDEEITLYLALVNGYQYGSSHYATVMLISDDVAPFVTVTASDAEATEAGLTPGAFTFTLSEPLPTDLKVSFEVTGSASAGSDYVALGKSITIPAGASTLTKSVTPQQDRWAEGDEIITLRLLDGYPYYYVGEGYFADVVLISDDAEPAFVNVYADDPEWPEDSLTPTTFTFTRSEPLDGALTVGFRAAGSAAPNKDYAALGTRVTFAPGSDTATVTLTPRDDPRFEGDETVQVTLAPGNGYSIGVDLAEVTLVDDEVMPPLNDTGNIRCADQEDNALACPVAGFPGLDAEYGRDVTASDASDGFAGFSFTKLANNGDPLPPDAPLGTGATDWACTRDNVTGLVWEVKTDAGGLRDQDWTYSWYEPDATVNGGGAGSASRGQCATKGRCDTAKYVADVNKTSLCGFSDWRLPSRPELSSLVVHDGELPRIDTDYFPNTREGVFWSATPAPWGGLSSQYAWWVNFGSEVHAYDDERGQGTETISLDGQWRKQQSLAVRLVR